MNHSSGPCLRDFSSEAMRTLPSTVISSSLVTVGVLAILALSSTWSNSRPHTIVLAEVSAAGKIEVPEDRALKIDEDSAFLVSNKFVLSRRKTKRGANAQLSHRQSFTAWRKN